MEKYRSSFSQHNTYEHCKRWWYFLKVKNIPVISDMCHADAGNVVHECLQTYYNNKEITLDIIKQSFEQKWKHKKLDISKIKHKKDNFWVMTLDGINLNKEITTTEMKIYYPEIVMYLDGVNTLGHEIYDWKTSSQRNEENEREYKKQGLTYAWGYKRKFGVVPNKVIFYYLALTNSKREYIIQPTEEDIQNTESRYNKILEEMQEIIQTKKMPEKCEGHCHVFCPYKDICESSEQQIKFTLHIYGNYIKLDGPVTPLLEKGIIKKFSYELKDAFFIKKRYAQANTTINFWNSHSRSLPIGFRDGLLKTLQDYSEHKKLQLDLCIEEHREFDNTKVDMPEEFINGRKLRDYQSEAVEVYLRKKIGILELATGAGKTECAIELIRRLKCKTLFIVDKTELMKQTIERIKSCLGIDVGQIGSGVHNVKDITVATIQTLTKNPEQYKEYLNSVRFVIFDETHKVASASYVKISKYLIGTEYRLGLSGTAWRNDGNDMQIHGVTGNIIHAVDSKFLIEKGFLVKPKIIFIKDYIDKEELKTLDNDCKIEIKKLEDEKRTELINEDVELSDREKYGIYYNKFIHNGVKRNTKILDLIHKHKENKVLILTKLVDHGKQLQDTLGDISKHLYGETSKQEREQIMEEFQKGNLNVLISTIGIWSEGLDMPSLQTIINVSGNKGDIKTIQVLGRILRILEGKVEATYIDFWDDSQYCRSASKSRFKALKNQGHIVEVIS